MLTLINSCTFWRASSLRIELLMDSRRAATSGCGWIASEWSRGELSDAKGLPAGDEGALVGVLLAPKRDVILGE